MVMDQKIRLIVQLKRENKRTGVEVVVENEQQLMGFLKDLPVEDYSKDGI